MAELKYYIQALYLSLFSRTFYADLIQNKKFLGMKYILLLAIVIAVPMTLQVTYIIKKTFPDSGQKGDEDIAHLQSQLPEIKLVNGEFKIGADSNVNILSRKGELVAIFDVENKVNDLNDYDNIMVVNKEGLRVKLPDDGGTVVMLSNEIAQLLKKYFVETGKGSILDSKQLLSDFQQFSQNPFIFIILTSVIWFYTKYLVVSIAYSFVAGFMFTIICKATSFNFRTSFRVAAFAGTPVAALEIISNALGGGLFSYTSLVYFITHMIYIHFAVESYKKFTLQTSRIN